MNNSKSTEQNVTTHGGKRRGSELAKIGEYSPSPLTALMIDMEFLALSPNAYPMSLGACIFNYDQAPGQLGDYFYENIFLSPTPGGQFVMDRNTIMWWFDQSTMARAALQDPAPKVLPEVLDSFTSWLKARPFHHFWSRGPLDIGIMDHCSSACGLDLTFPSKKQWRDCRTLDDFAEPEFIESISQNYTAHNALDDALKQAAIVKHVYQRFPVILKEMKGEL